MTSPAFQFYVQDFLTGTMYMTAEEIGAYMLLLCHQWDKGALPASDRELLRLSRSRMKVLEVVKKKFVAGEDGLLRNERMEKEREKQNQWRAKSSEAGRKSGEVRRARSNQRSDLVAQVDEPNANSSSSSSSSTSSSTSTSEKDISAEPKDFIKEKNATALADIERTVPPEDWPRCLSQWNLTVLGDPHWQYTGDDAQDLRLLTARLRKWCATWSHNAEKEKQKLHYARHPPAHHLDRIGDAADQVLAAIGHKIINGSNGRDR